MFDTFASKSTIVFVPFVCLGDTHMNTDKPCKGLRSERVPPPLHNAVVAKTSKTLQIAGYPDIKLIPLFVEDL